LVISYLIPKDYETNTGIIFALSAFLFISLPFVFFIIYDWKISRQQKKIVSNALRTDAIVSELFPSNVRDQLYRALKNGGTQDECIEQDNQVIAELHPDTTVLFAGKMQ
jgi:hypothetical protein